MVNVVDDFLNVSKGYMMNTATAAVSDEKMEPINKAPEQRQIVVTGQYLYESFIVSDEAQITKMGIIRKLADEADALQIKGACDKMVEKAKEIDAAAGVPEKVVKDGKEVVNRGPKTQTAMNARTVIQQAWGALRFARDQLNSLGYDDKTGYQDMRVLAKKALDEARKTWKGDNALTQADRERKALQRQQKGIQAVIGEVQKENPMNIGESFMEYQVRVGQLAQERAEEVRKEMDAKAVKDAADKLTKSLDENQQYLLILELMDRLGLETVSSAEEEQPDEKVDQSQPQASDERTESVNQEPAHA